MARSRMPKFVRVRRATEHDYARLNEATARFMGRHGFEIPHGMDLSENLWIEFMGWLDDSLEGCEPGDYNIVQVRLLRQVRRRALRHSLADLIEGGWVGYWTWR